MEQKLETQENITDLLGFETLDSISQANNFNEWMYKVVSGDLDGEILEIGSGIGNITEYFVRGEFQISASDMRKEYCDFLERKFEGRNNFQSVYQIDIVDEDFDRKHKNLFGKFDAVFALNIIEHVENDDLALKNCLKLLRKGGKLVILVPAFMGLYNIFDEGLGHFRRYNRKSLEKIYQNNGITIVKTTYFNFIGLFGWWFSGTVLKKKTIPSGQMRLYNSMVWLFKMIDFFTHKFFGLSVVCFGKKE